MAHLSSALLQTAGATTNKTAPGGAIGAPSGVASLGAVIQQINGQDYVLIDAISTVGGHDQLMGDLEAVGLVNASQFGRVVSGFIPVENIGSLASVNSLQSANAGVAQGNTGSVTTQSDAALLADEVRADYGVDGTGVTVGVLSDSYDTSPFFGIDAADDVASGDLPDDVVVLEDFDNGGTIDEGRAMMQLIHDIAPGADLQFATAFNGQAGFANNILNLAAAGSDIIVDDIIYFAEPAFADGIIAQAAAQVVADGVPYFSSAGNNSNAGYQSAFVDSGVNGFFGGTTHDWDPGAGVDPVLDFILDTGTTRFILQWDDAYASTGLTSPGAASDLDIWLTLPGTDPTQVFFGATTINIGGDPIEVFSITNSGGPVELGLAIESFTGPLPSDMRIIAFDPNNFVDAEYDFFGSTVYGHAAAEGALGVGAADWDETPEFGVNPPLLESFSSFGPTEILFDTEGNRLATPDMRDAVDFVAPQGGNTTFFISDTPDDPDSFPNFFGTSAAAPNAAAVAALMLEANPDLTPAEIEALLEGSAIDMDNPATPGFDVGEDDATGAGLIQANIAVRDAAGVAVSPELVSVNDWFQNGSGGFNATFKLTLTEAMIDNGTVENWVLDVDHLNGGVFSTGWTQGYNGPVTFNPGTGVFSTLDQNYQQTLEAGDMITFAVQVQGSGFDINDFLFQFSDLDPEPIIAATPPVDIDASNLNDWGAGVSQQVRLTNTGTETVDGWTVKLDLDAGELANITLTNVWGATVSNDGEDLFFNPLSYNDEISAGGSQNFGFNADILDDSGAAWDAGDFMFV